MTEEQMTSEDSHYEVSLTAGQAFIAFALLLCSLAAAFVFGLMVGKGQAADRLVVRRQAPVIEAGEVKKNEAKIVELGVEDEEIVEEPTTTVTESTSTEAPPVIIEESAPAASEVAATQSPTPAAEEPKPQAEPAASAQKAAEKPAEKPVEKPAQTATEPQSSPVYAQVFSSGDRVAAEQLAAKLINSGFNSAYVDRNGATYRVRVKFSTESQARAAADKLRSLARTEPWITRQ